MTNSSTNLISPWPHRLAVLLVCTTFPLIWVGGLVTTTQAGMAVPDWPSTYGYNMFLYPWTTWLSAPWDLFIEHGHRLLAALVGIITIAFTVTVWRNDSRSWMKALSLLALVGVIAQGTLGGMRVLMDERTLAKIHGCMGPVFFALTDALAVFTSRWWREGSVAKVQEKSPAPQSGSLLRLAFLTTLLAYVQLVLGAELRHIQVGASPQYFRIAVYFHLIMAAVLTLHVVWLTGLVLVRHLREKAFSRPALALVCLIFCQLLLGSGSWVAKYAWPGFLADQNWAANYTISAGGMLQSLIVTGHVATGSLILVTCLVLALRLGRWQFLTSSANQSVKHSTATFARNNVTMSVGQFWPVEAAQ